MKLDENFSCVFICPVTKEHIQESKHYYNCGVCPSCGDQERGTNTHAEKQSGKWIRPSLIEYIFGKKPEWVQKKECNCDQ